MKKPRIGVDVDGVLADFVGPCLKIISEMLGRDVSTNEVTGWGFDEDLVPKNRLDEFWRIIAEPGFCTNLEPFPGAIEGMVKLGQVADIYIVTSTPRSCPQWAWERTRWVGRHFGIDRKKVVHTPAKYVFNAGMLVDDKAQNLQEWSNEYSSGIPVLWNQVWNRDAEFTGGVGQRIVRTNDWDTVCKLVEAVQ